MNVAETLADIVALAAPILGITFKKNNPGCNCCAESTAVDVCNQCTTTNGTPEFLKVVVSNMANQVPYPSNTDCTTTFCTALNGTFVLQNDPYLFEGGDPCRWTVNLTTVPEVNWPTTVCEGLRVTIVNGQFGQAGAYWHTHGFDVFGNTQWTLSKPTFRNATTGGAAIDCTSLTTSIWPDMPADGGSQNLTPCDFTTTAGAIMEVQNTT